MGIALCHRKAAMAKILLHGLDWHPFHCQIGGEGVTQIVKPKIFNLRFPTPLFESRRLHLGTHLFLEKNLDEELLQTLRSDVAGHLSERNAVNLAERYSEAPFRPRTRVARSRTCPAL